ncbi:MAG: hypothetical protein ACUVXJ_00640 [Phycisphaerae bacterium]
MRTGTLRTNVVISLVFGGLAASAWGQAVPDPSMHAPDSPVNGVVKITCDPALLPLNPQSVGALLESRFVAGEALKQALPPEAELSYMVEFRPLPGGTTVVPVGVVPGSPMMGGTLPQPPQAGGIFLPAPQGGDGMGGYRGKDDDGQRSGSGGGSAGGSDAPAHGGYGGGGMTGPAGGPSAGPGMPGAPLGGAPMPAEAVPDRFIAPGVPRIAGRPPMVDMPVPGPRESSILGQIEVQIDGAEPRHNEAFLRAICERMQQALNGLWETQMTSINRQLEMSRDELLRSEKKLRELQEQRRDLLGAGQLDLTPEAVMDQIRRLDDERQRMEMDFIGQQARLKAVQQQIQATSERILRESTDDAVIKPLEQKLAELRNHLDMIQSQYEKGMVDQSEVQKVRIALSEGEVQLAEARRKVAQAGGGEVLGKLNTELAMLSVTVAETEARLTHLREQIEKTKQLAGVADEYEMRILMEMPHARRVYESARLRVEELEQRIRTAVAPMVTVIGAPTSKPAK